MQAVIIHTIAVNFIIIRWVTANVIKLALMINLCLRNKRHAKLEYLTPPSVSANRSASLCEPSHFIMQLCPHLSSTISGFLLMANTAHSINPGQGNR